MNWLRPPSEHGPADTLRWVRRVELAFIPFAVILAAVLLVKGSHLWWIGFASAASSVIAVAPMGLAIRRAEERTILNPERWQEWRRRADRLTVSIFIGLAAAGVILAYVFSGRGLAALLAASFLIASAAASAVHRRAGSLRR